MKLSRGWGKGRGLFKRVRVYILKRCGVGMNSVKHKTSCLMLEHHILTTIDGIVRRVSFCRRAGLWLTNSSQIALNKFILCVLRNEVYITTSEV